ncbi:MAG: porin family protein [Bacteroidales bacterium]|nr:porin family protein [Bacteroidales bacterium]
MKEVYTKLSHLVLIFFVTALISNYSIAQTTYSKQSAKPESRPKKSSETTPSYSGSSPNALRLSVSFGPTLFFGDVKQYKYYPVSNYENEWKFGGSLMLEYQIGPIFSLRGQALYSELAGTRREWKKYFNSELIEFNLNTAINLNNLIGGYRADRPWNINLVVGVGLLNYNTTVYELGSNKILAKRGFGNGTGIDGRTLEGVLMGGIGFDYHFNKNWSLRIETANRALNSDLLDNHANGFKYDVYNHTSIGFSYTFKSTGKNIRMVPEAESDLQVVEPDALIPVEPTDKSDSEGFNRVIDVLELQPKAEPEKIVEEVIVKETPTPKPVYTGTEYRVQIRARYGRQISKQELAKNYNLPAAEIMENTYNGYYIYTIGSYSNYDQAAQRRNTIRSTHGVYDAFIVAFRNGERLSKLP